MNDYNEERINIHKKITDYYLKRETLNNINIFYDHKDVNEYITNFQTFNPYSLNYASNILFVDPYDLRTVKVDAIRAFIQKYYCEVIFNVMAFDFTRNKDDNRIFEMLGNKYEIKFFVVNNKMNFSFETFLKESLSDIVEMGYSPSIKALCWMQGETDSILKSTAEQYEKNMILLLYDIRNKFGQDISFIDAQITDWDRVTPNSYQYLVNNAKIRIAAVGSNNYIVDSIGLTKKEDDVAHYDSVSEFELGKRFGNIISNICY
ncbi:MAG: hypothetical protein MSH65_01475 [Spirochaetia bacterium]|nr:hypothetical protein [Spirochaetia bacterium]